LLHLLFNLEIAQTDLLEPHIRNRQQGSGMKLGTACHPSRRWPSSDCSWAVSLVQAKSILLSAFLNTSFSYACLPHLRTTHSWWLRAYLLDFFSCLFQY